MPNFQEKFYGDTQKHIPLRELLPLPSPLSVHIDPCNLCNLKCEFCPTGHPHLLSHVARPKGYMTVSLFKKAIDGIKCFEKNIIRLHLYKDGEPLLNRNLSAMVQYASNAGVADSIEVTTNGILLNAERSKHLVEAGVNRIRISIQAINGKGYKRLARASICFVTLVAQLHESYAVIKTISPTTVVHVKIIDTGLSPEERSAFKTTFSGCCDELHIDSLMGWTRSDLFDFTLGMPLSTGIDSRTAINERRSICPMPFYTCAINVDGSVSVCCVDWSHQTIVGNIADKSLPEIWNGELMRKFRLLHLKGLKNDNPACRTCKYLQGLPETSNIDAESERLLMFYKH